jgi:hypothetical protein
MFIRLIEVVRLLPFLGQCRAPRLRLALRLGTGIRRFGRLALLALLLSRGSLLVRGLVGRSGQQFWDTIGHWFFMLGAWLARLLAVGTDVFHVVRVAVDVVVLTALVAGFPARVLDMALKTVSVTSSVKVVKWGLTATEDFFANFTLQRGQIHRRLSLSASRALKQTDFLSLMCRCEQYQHICKDLGGVRPTLRLFSKEYVFSQSRHSNGRLGSPLAEPSCAAVARAETDVGAPSIVSSPWVSAALLSIPCGGDDSGEDWIGEAGDITTASSKLDTTLALSRTEIHDLRLLLLSAVACNSLHLAYINPTSHPCILVTCVNQSCSHERYVGKTGSQAFLR